jgi:hypothetical protein
VESDGLHERLLAAVGKRSYRVIGELTDQHPETVRRYLQGQHPSVEFVSALCTELDLNANWLLTGQGPMRASEVRGQALDNADPRELLSAVANALEQLTFRVDRIEVFVQSIETRLRVRHPDRERPSTPEAEPSVESKATNGQGTRRARTVADAIAKRPRPDAD